MIMVALGTVNLARLRNGTHLAFDDAWLGQQKTWDVDVYYLLPSIIWFDLSVVVKSLVAWAYLAKEYKIAKW